MKTRMTRRLYASAVVIAAALAWLMPMLAAPVMATPAVPAWVPFGAQPAYSPDGKFMAYFANEVPASLYVKNIHTGAQMLVAKRQKGSAGWGVVDDLSFSPDAGRLVFGASPPRMYAGAIYTVKVDGSGFMVLATDGRNKSGQEIALWHPLFSPDGSKVLVEMLVSDGKTDNQGRWDHSQDKLYVAMLAADKAKQTPEKLVEGIPFFWSADGQAVYYAGADHVVMRFDLATKQSTSTGINPRELHVGILGRFPGTDDMLVDGRHSVSVINLDGGDTSPEAVKLASQISLKDPDGRFLQSLAWAGPHQVLLNYAIGLRPTGSSMSLQNSTLLNYQ